MLVACLTLMTSCGGSDTSAPALAPAPADTAGTASATVARINAAQGVLELPLLQSGELLYADVRIRFSLDGSFELLSWRPAASALAQADADLQPPVALADLQRSSQPLKLNIRRLHMDAQVYQAVTVALENGRWRYPQPLVPAATLTSKDLRANPALFARDHQLMVITATPARAEMFALRLESHSYRFCMEAQDDGVDSIALLDAQGAELLTVRAGGPCAAYTAVQGLYKMRYTYGGSGAGRTAFMRQRPDEQDALTQPLAGQFPLQMADSVKEYWGILATFLDPITQRVSNDGFLGMAGSWPGNGQPLAGSCFSTIAAFITSTALNTANPLAATHLFDGANFFERINDSAGHPARIGSAFACPDGRLKFEWAYQTETALVLAVPGFTVPDDHPVKINGFTAERNTFVLQGASGKGGDNLPDSPLGFPLGVEITEPAFSGGLRPLTPSQIADWLPEYLTVLRYRPDGLLGTSIPAQGQVALFNSKDCTGAAMVVDKYDLPGIIPGGPLGNFDGSLKLGALTTATVYASKFHRGERQQLDRSGCLVSGWGTTGWKAASLSIKMEIAQIIVSTKSCEQCNLAGIDLSNTDLSNGKFYGANLNNARLGHANLSGADLRYASLQGAQLPNANLDAANLCSASLNAAPSSAGSSNVAANLSGAYLRNASLYASNLTGANFSNASFYSASQGACQPSDCSTYQRPACANAYGAKLDSAKFSNAYLTGVDMSNVTGSAADFSHAVLNGASFRNATLTPDINGTPANFSNAFLLGADFTAATLVSPILTNAYGDDNTSGGCMQTALDASYTAFPGFAMPTPLGSNTCAKAAAPAPTCVQFTYNKATLGLQLAKPATPLNPNTNCFSKAPLCGDAFTGAGPNTCW
ncbi:MAG: pentapeptide repeat protein [Polaromonas sp.]|nr:pentapeptide repeat protein [Polaromonas sp.]